MVQRRDRDRDENRLRMSAVREEGSLMSRWVVSKVDGKLQPAVLEPVVDHGGPDERQNAHGSDDVRMRVEFSSVNYKDALALEGRPGVVRSFPLVPGIDAAGYIDDDDAAMTHGPRGPVVVTGAGLGEQRDGGLAPWVWVPRDACVEIPEPWTVRDAAAVGTAGVTAALCVNRIRSAGIVPGRGPIAVTGASGGVGSVAIMLLNALGYETYAVTSRPGDVGEYLRALGAAHVVDRHEVAQARRPLGSEQWAAAVDTVGGETLAGLLAVSAWGGVVAACGLAQSPSLETTVLPFILRNVTLAGVDSVRVTRDERQRAWRLIFELLDRAHLASIVRVVPLEDARTVAASVLAGTHHGRTVVSIGPGAKDSV